MADARRGWLELQRDLGGDEVILDVRLEARAISRPAEPPARRPDPPPVPRPVVAPAPVVESPVRPSFAADGAAWRKTAPAIPGPGHSVRFDAPLPAEFASASLDELAAMANRCTLCPLSQSRTHAVPGEGEPAARLMLIGEGPGETEDLTGRPFVGAAGKLLDKILESIETPRPTVFIANVVKCRPPRNRTPLPDERAACSPYLRRQIELIRPRVLLALGSTSAEALLGMKQPLGALRLKVHQWNGIPLIVTYHPAALLRNPNWKRPAWDDVRIARQLLDLDA